MIILVKSSFDRHYVTVVRAVDVFSAGTSVLWWLYIDHRLFSNTTAPRVAKETSEEAELDLDKRQALLVYAASATVFTVRLNPQNTECRRTI